jgi:hypothetical protein
MKNYLVIFAFLMICLAWLPLIAEEEVVDTTVRETPAVGYADENVKKCQFGTNAGTIADMTGAFVPGMSEPTPGGTQDGTKTQ